MTILSVVQEAASELGLPSVTSAVGSTDATTLQLLAFAGREGKRARDRHPWPQLSKERTFALVTGQDSYALPGDFDYQLFLTHWNRTSYWPLIGPLTPQQWQAVKSGLVNILPREAFRVKGATDSQLFIHPTPTTSDNGNTIAFEYQSLSWLRPRTWAQNTAFTAGSYCFYNGNLYKTSSAGVSGTTAPTHISGTTSDGGINWAYQSGAYESILADTDVSHLSEDALCMGVQWRFLRSKGLEYDAIKRECDRIWDEKAASLSGAQILPLSGVVAGIRYIGPDQIKDTGWGS